MLVFLGALFILKKIKKILGNYFNPFYLQTDYRSAPLSLTLTLNQVSPQGVSVSVELQRH
jgi:hypothetical protein